MKTIAAVCAFACVAGCSSESVVSGKCKLPAEVASQKTVVDRLVTAARVDPRGWSSDKFHWTYCDGTEVWVANADYGIEVGNDSVGGLYHDIPQVRFKSQHQRLWDAYSDWAEWKILHP